MKKKFNWRSFVSFSLALSFLMTSLSGIILYLSPPGRIARWISWMMLGFKKGQWEDLHTLFSYMMIIFGLLHLLAFNWRPFVSYIRLKVSGSLNRKMEMLAAMAVFVLIFVFTLARTPPVYSVMRLGKNISSGWGNRQGLPPAPHAEEMTFSGFVELFLGKSADEVIEVLVQAGYKIGDGDRLFSDVASENGMTSAAFYKVISGYFDTLVRIPDK